MLSARTGLTLRQSDRGALAVDGSVGPLPSGASATLRSLVLDVINGRGGQRPVNIVATNQTDDAFFDRDSRGAGVSRSMRDALDMDDFQAISQYPELQAAVLGHVLSERMTPGRYLPAHVYALDVGRSIISEMTDTSAQIRNEYEGDLSKFPIDPHFTNTPSGNAAYVRTHDYGTVSYSTASLLGPPDPSTRRSPVLFNTVVGVRRDL